MSGPRHVCHQKGVDLISYVTETYASAPRVSDAVSVVSPVDVARPEFIAQLRSSIMESLTNALQANGLNDQDLTRTLCLIDRSWVCGPPQCDAYHDAALARRVSYHQFAVPKLCALAAALVALKQSGAYIGNEESLTKIIQGLVSNIFWKATTEQKCQHLLDVVFAQGRKLLEISKVPPAAETAAPIPRVTPGVVRRRSIHKTKAKRRVSRTTAPTT